MSYINIKGERFGKLTAIEFMPKTKERKSCWRCLCDCGNEHFVQVTDLRTGRTKSCGCFKKKLTSQRFKKHGQVDTRLYKIWVGMKSRCNNEENSSYGNYGGRGIRVCPEWESDFEAFRDWSLNNGYHKDLSIDRIDVDGDYEPANCRWANTAQQARNTRNTVRVAINNSTRPLIEWCEIFETDYDTVYGRIRWGWPEVEALITPKGERR